MNTSGQARPWEFRWRIVIMLVSLPVCGILFVASGMTPGRWNAPEIELWQQIAAVVLGSLGLLLRVWGTSALSAKRMLRLQARGETLVESGPFAIVRNPLYLGTMLIIGGWSVLYGWLPALLFTLFHAIRFHRIVIYEESLIQAECGARFEDYQTRVPRWIPRFRKITDAGWPHTSFSAVFSNSPFVGMTIALCVIAWTGKTGIFLPLMIAGLLVSGVFLLTRRPKPSDSSPDH